MFATMAVPRFFGVRVDDQREPTRECVQKLSSRLLWSARWVCETLNRQTAAGKGDHDRISCGCDGPDRCRSPGGRHAYPSAIPGCGRQPRRLVLGSRPPQPINPALIVEAEVLRR